MPLNQHEIAVLHSKSRIGAEGIWGKETHWRSPISKKDTWQIQTTNFWSENQEILLQKREWEAHRPFIVAKMARYRQMDQKFRHQRNLNQCVPSLQMNSSKVKREGQISAQKAKKPRDFHPCFGFVLVRCNFPWFHLKSFGQKIWANCAPKGLY